MSRNITEFTLNRSTNVEKLADGNLVSICRLRDTFTEAEIRLVVRMPEMEIAEISGRLRHAYFAEITDLNARLQALLGVRVGAGMLKIIKGLLGDTENLDQIVYMVEEACHGVILHLTKKVLLKAPADEAGEFDFYANMVKKSIRLYDRCAAFAKGSPLVAEFEAERESGGVK